MSTTITEIPNYRIYDRTGGGVTHDIYATDLDSAIEAGREWIEDGDWERDEMETPLDCCVREIVRVPDLRSIESLPGVNEVTIEDDVVIADVDMDSVAAVGATIGARMARIGEPDSEGYARHAVCLGHALPLIIDEDATLTGQSWDCRGVCPAKDAPECSSDEHDWQAPYEIVGGCRENPGVWGSRHGATLSRDCCAHCGIYRTVDHGSTDLSNGRQCTSVRYEDADENSLAWISENRGEWTEAQAKDWIARHDDMDDLDSTDLEKAFLAVFGRAADDDDRENGLWSLLTA